MILLFEIKKSKINNRITRREAKRMLHLKERYTMTELVTQLECEKRGDRARERERGV